MWRESSSLSFDNLLPHFVVQLESVDFALVARQDVGNIFIISNPTALVPLEGSLDNLRFRRHVCTKFTSEKKEKRTRTERGIYIALLYGPRSIHAILESLLVRTSSQSNNHSFSFFSYIRRTMSTSSDYVKLISSDGFEFIIHREAAMRSGTIKNMLVGPGKETFQVGHFRIDRSNCSQHTAQFKESIENEIPFRDIK